MYGGKDLEGMMGEDLAWSVHIEEGQRGYLGRWKERTSI